MKDMCYIVFNKFIQDSLRRLRSRRFHGKPVIFRVIIELESFGKVSWNE